MLSSSPLAPFFVCLHCGHLPCKQDKEVNCQLLSSWCKAAHVPGSSDGAQSGQPGRFDRLIASSAQPAASLTPYSHEDGVASSRHDECTCEQHPLPWPAGGGGSRRQRRRRQVGRPSTRLCLARALQNLLPAIAATRQAPIGAATVRMQARPEFQINASSTRGMGARLSAPLFHGPGA